MTLSNGLYLFGVILIIIGLASLIVARTKKNRAVKSEAETYLANLNTAAQHSSNQKQKQAVRPQRTADPRKVQLARVSSAIHSLIESK